MQIITSNYVDLAYNIKSKNIHGAFVWIHFVSGALHITYALQVENSVFPL